MSKKVLIISTSLRLHSNSDALADAFAKGAKDAGNTVEMVSLKEKQISFCKGCLACQKTQQCVIKDDAAEIVKKMKEADVIVYATPVYYYGISGQLKTLLDRANPLYASDYQFRDIYLLATAADDSKSTMDRPLTALDGWIVCFEKAHLAGSVFAGGVNVADEIQGHAALTNAYEMGKKIK